MTKSSSRQRCSDVYRVPHTRANPQPHAVGLAHDSSVPESRVQANSEKGSESHLGKGIHGSQYDRTLDAGELALPDLVHAASYHNRTPSLSNAIVHRAPSSRPSPSIKGILNHHRTSQIPLHNPPCIIGAPWASSGSGILPRTPGNRTRNAVKHLTRGCFRNPYRGHRPRRQRHSDRSATRDVPTTVVANTSPGPNCAQH